MGQNRERYLLFIIHNNIHTVRLSCPSQLPPPVGNMKLEVDIEEEEEGVTGGKVAIRSCEE